MKKVEFEANCFEVGGEAELVENAEAAGDSLGDLKEAVDGFDGGVGEAGFHESDNARQMEVSHESLK